MKKLILLVFISMALSSCVIPAGASDFKDEGRATDIRVEVGKVTEVTFPEKIAKVIKGGQPDSVLVEVLGNSVYLLPKTDTPPDIFVTTTSGNSYPLNLHISQEHDIKVEVGSSKNRQSNSSKGGYSDVMDLMKDLLLSREPSMATILPEAGQACLSGRQVFLSNHEIKLTVDKAYELGNWKAYVLTAHNLIKNAVIIPVEQMSLPNLLAVSAEKDMLAAKGQQGDSTKVYMITGQ